MKSVKRLLLGIALILVAIWSILYVQMLPLRIILIFSLFVLVIGVIFVFLGFFTGEPDSKSRD